MKENKELLLIASILMIGFTMFGILINILMQQPLSIMTYVLYSLYGLSSIIFMYYSFSKKEINRGLLIILSIIMFIGNVVSGILGFVYYSKTNTSKKRELPKLEVLPGYKKIVYILIFLISMGLIFIVPLFYENKILNYILEGLIILVLAIVFRKDLKRDFKYFKEYFKEYSGYVFKMYLISLGFMLVLNISIKLFTGLSQATNQTDLNEAFKSNPLLVILAAAIMAPFMEELLFRCIFRKVLNNKYAYLISSSIIFGALHVVDDFKSPKELLFILSYSLLGFFFGTVYEKTNNLFANIFFHFVQNSMALLGMILLNYFM